MEVDSLSQYLALFERLNLPARSLFSERQDEPGTPLLDRALFDKNNSIHAESDYPDCDSRIHDLLSFTGNGLSLEEDDLIIDAGCGDGRFAINMARHFSNRVIGVDNSEEALKRARSLRQGLRPAEFMKMDINGMADKFRGRVGLVTANLVLHNLPDLPAALSQIRQLLTPKGSFHFRDVHIQDEAANSALRVLYALRKSLPEEIFIKHIIEPLKAFEEFPAMLDCANAMSHLASYTVEEINKALCEAGFKNISIERDLSRGIIGHASN